MAVSVSSGLPVEICVIVEVDVLVEAVSVAPVEIVLTDEPGVPVTETVPETVSVPGVTVSVFGVDARSVETVDVRSVETVEP